MLALSRKANATVWVVVLGCLAMAPMLLPSDAELGSHLLSDNEQVEARHYLEAALEGHGKQQAVVVPLAKIYSEQGRHEEALDLLRQLKRRTPELGVMRRNLLRQSGRLLTYVEDLERQRAPEPGPKELDELGRLYGAQELVELRLAVLQRMRRTRPNDLTLSRQIVHLHLRQGNRLAALRMMRGLWLNTPSRINRADFLLLARLAIELDPAEAAFRLVHTHIDRLGLPKDRVAMARVMLGVGRFGQAVGLLDQAMRHPRASADTIEVWAVAQMALGKTGLAYKELRARADSASSRTTRLLCNLALRQGDDLGALRIGGQADFLGLGDATLLALAHAAMRLKSRDRLKRILARIKPASLHKDAVATAHMYWVVGDRQAALRWAKEAADQPTLPHAQRLWLAELYLRANRPREVARLMRAASGAPGQGVSPLRLALMWWRANGAQKGLRGWPTGGRDVRVRAGRALLLAGVGKTREAFQLVRGERSLAGRLLSAERGGAAVGGARARVQDWLQALAAEADQAKFRPLTTWVFGQLLSLTPSDRRLRLALSQSQLADKLPSEAWTTISKLPAPLSKAEADARRVILLAAHRAKATVQDALIAEAVSYLGTLELKTPDAQSWVHLLLELGANREARPFVDKLAATGSQSWQSRRIALLTDLGDVDSVRKWWRGRGANKKLDASARLHAAAQLLRVKDRTGAIAIYRDLGAHEGPKGVAVGQLVQLWGPRPPGEAITWLSARASASKGGKGSKKAGWLRHLLWMNATSDVERLLGDNPAEGPLLDIAVDTLTAQRRYADLSALTLRRLPKLRNETTVRRLAQLCAAHRQTQAAMAAYTRLVALNDRDGVALRFLAQSTRGQPAIRWWRKLFSLPRANRPAEVWQDRAALGELLMARGHEQDGHQQLQVALRLAGAANTVKRDEVRGRLLARVGRHMEAVDAITRAMAKRPCDDRLRADLVSSLMASHELERARKIVDRPAHCRKDSGQ